MRLPSAAVLECLPVVQDTSIRGTTNNPKVQNWRSSLARPSIAPPLVEDVGIDEAEALASQEALKKLSVIFGPIVLRVALRRRRLQSWTGMYPPRIHTPDAVVSAFISSTSIFSRWPEELLYSIASATSFEYKAPSERFTYYKESYISSGLIVLLHGEVQEQRQSSKKNTTTKERPIHSKSVRTHRAPAILCEIPVLSEDCSSTSFVTVGMADIGVIPSRWFWNVVYRYLLMASSGGAPVDLGYPDALDQYNEWQASEADANIVRECLHQTVLPYRTDILLSTYYPTTVVLQRSWISPYLSVSDRVKLCRSMEVKAVSVGDIVCKEGTYSPYIYIVRRGSLTVKVKGVPLAILSPGNTFGEVSVLMGDPRNSTVEANTIVELYCLHAEELLHRFSKYPEVGNKLIEAAVAYRHRWMEAGKQPRDIFGLAVLLVGIPCLSHVPEAMRNAVAAKAEIVSYPAESVIVYKGDPCDALYVIGRGSVRLCSTGPEKDHRKAKNGKEAGKNTTLKHQPPSVPVTEATDSRSCGEYFGEYCLLPHTCWQAAIAETTVDVWRIRAEVLRESLTSEVGLGQAEEVTRQGIALHEARHRSSSGASESTVASPKRKKDAPAPPASKRKGKGSLPPPATKGKGKTPAKSAPKSSPGGKKAPLSSRAAHGKKEKEIDKSAGGDSNVSRDDPSENKSSNSPTTADMSTPDGDHSDPSPTQEEINWPEYAMDQTAVMLDKLEEEEEAMRQAAANDVSTATGDGANKLLPRRRMRELQPSDKDNEQGLKGKVLELVSCAEGDPQPADCDLPPVMDELKAVIVEQLFLTPTEEQARFLKQVNESNIKLVTQEEQDGFAGTDGEEGMMNEERGTIPGVDKLIGETMQALVEVNPVQAALPLEDIIEEEKERAVDFKHLSLNPEDIAMGDSQLLFEGVDPLRSSLTDLHERPSSRSRDASFAMSQMNRSSTSKSIFCRSTSMMEPRQGRRESIGMLSMNGSGSPRLFRDGSMSAGARPWSTPWAGMGGADMSLSANLVSPRAPPRPVSVDYRQQGMNVKSLPEPGKSQTVLERFIRVEDEEYLNSLVKVMPLEQQREILMDDTEENNEAEELAGSGHSSVSSPLQSHSKMLILLHVKECRYLDKTVMQSCLQPMVKARIRQTTRLRTPPMKNITTPSWSPKEASFITFVSRSEWIDFEIGDGAAKHAAPLYTCRLPLSESPTTNAIAQRSMKLLPPGSSPASTDAPSSSSSASSSSHVPYLTITLVSIVASEYQPVQRRLMTFRRRKSSKWKPSAMALPPFANRSAILSNDGVETQSGKSENEEEDDEKEKRPSKTGAIQTRSGCQDADGNTVVFQVLGVRQLKHRVEAWMKVTLESDGENTTVLETPRTAGKTRHPSWPGVVAYCTVQSDGFLRFDLYHKTTILSSIKLAVDVLVFGGLGPRTFPLRLAKNSNEVIGDLELNVLQTKIDTEKASTTLEREERVLFLHLERCVLEGVSTRGEDSRAIPTELPSASLPTVGISFTSAVEPDLLVVVRNESGDLLLQTPLVLSTFDASWTPEVASCFIPTPLLRGTSTKYSVEAYDSTVAKANLIGLANVLVTRDGFGTENRYDIRFHGPRFHGRFRVTSLCVPVVDVHAWVRQAESAPRTSNTSFLWTPSMEFTLHQPRCPENDLLLLLHVVGCEKLFQTVRRASLEADSIVTASFQTKASPSPEPIAGKPVDTPVENTEEVEEEFLRTSSCPHTSHPKWRMTSGCSTALLRVRQEDAQTMIRWSVYDGMVHAADRLGTAVGDVRALCLTGVHEFPLEDSLQERPTTGRVLSASPSRLLGTLKVETFCGKLGAAIFPRGRLTRLLSKDLFRPPNASTGELPFSTSYTSEGEGKKSVSMTVHPAQLGESHLEGTSASPFIRCTLTNVCQILPQAVSKTIEVVVRDGTRVVISSLKTDVQSDSEVWYWDEAVTCVDMSHAKQLHTVLTVDVTAKDVVEGSGGNKSVMEDAEEDGKKDPLVSRKASDVEQEEGKAVERNSNAAAGGKKVGTIAANSNMVVIGSGTIPLDTLRLVKPDEVVLYTVFLKTSSPKGDRGKNPTSTATSSVNWSRKSKVMEELREPNISFSLMGLVRAV